MSTKSKKSKLPLFKKQSLVKSLVLSSILKYSFSNSISLQQAQSVKYSLKNSLESFTANNRHKCILDTFKQLEYNCESYSDTEKSSLSYMMTLCLYSKLRRHTGFDCQANDYTCSQYLSGDSWNTFLSFNTQIDNACFYYKIIQWEESIERTYSELEQSTQSIISSMEQSKTNTKELLEYQQLLGDEAKKFHSQTIKELNTVMELSGEYKEFETKLKDSMESIQDKMSQSDRQIENLYQFIDDKINLLSNIYEFLVLSNKYTNDGYFYVYFIISVLTTMMFKCLDGIRPLLSVEIIGFYLIENYFAWLINTNKSPFDLSSFLFFYVLRGIFVFIFTMSLLVKLFVCSDKEGKKEKILFSEEGSQKHLEISSLSEETVQAFKALEGKVACLFNEVKTSVVCTPVWMKKFASRVGHGFGQSVRKNFLDSPKNEAHGADHQVIFGGNYNSLRKTNQSQQDSVKKGYQSQSEALRVPFAKNQRNNYHRDNFYRKQHFFISGNKNFIDKDKFQTKTEEQLFSRVKDDSKANISSNLS